MLAESPDFCPLDDRRTDAEVLLKRLAVTLAVLGLYGHLNSLRGIVSEASGDYVYRKPALYILLFCVNPLYPLLETLFDGFWAVVKARVDAAGQANGPSHRASNTASELGRLQRLRFYLAAAAGVCVLSVQEGGTEENYRYENGVSLLHLLPAEVQVEKRTQRVGLKFLGRLVLLGATAVQCGATVLLGFRREMRGAATILDRRQYLFALSGLAILVRTFVLQALGGRYTLKGTGADHQYSGKGERLLMPILVTEATHYIVSLSLVLFYAGEFTIGVELAGSAWLGFIVVGSPWDGFKELILGSEMWIMLWEAAVSILRSVFPQRRGGKLARKEIWENMKALVIVSMLPLLYLVLISLGSLGIYLFVRSTMIAEADAFTLNGQPFPIDTPCPFLWKDPLADSMWAF